MSKSLEEIRASGMKLPVEDRAVLSAEPPQIGDEQASAIDQKLLSRLGGPFVPFDPNDDSFWDGIEAAVRSELRLTSDADASA